MAPLALRYRAALFDALGTLVELEPPSPALRSTLSRRYGIELSEAEAKDAMLAEMSYYREHHAEGRDSDSLADLRRRCALVLRERIPETVSLGLDDLTELLLEAIRFSPFPDAAESLARLRAAGMRLAIVSNWDCSLGNVLGQVGLGGAVDEIVVSAEVGAVKPDPRVFTLALDRLRCEPQNALFVGDSIETDIAGARAAGIRAVLIDRTGTATGDGELEKIATLADLPALVGAE